MDFFQTREHYRKKKNRRMLLLCLRLAVMLGCAWGGWFLGYGQNSVLTARSNNRVISLSQENERLQQRLTALSGELDNTRKQRDAIELQQSGTAEETAATRLGRKLARQLAAGVPENRIAFALDGLAESTRCRPLGGQDVAVATDLFAGTDSAAHMLDGDIRISLSGEAGKDATRDKPWFDPARPVSMRIAYLGGEQVLEGILPRRVNILAANWTIRIEAKPADLQGYVNIALEKCSTG